MQRKELSEGRFIKVNEESDCDIKNENASEEVALASKKHTKKTFPLKEPLPIFHNIKSAKGKMLVTDPY